MPTCLLGRNQCAARSAEQVEHVVAGARRVLHRSHCQLDWLSHGVRRCRVGPSNRSYLAGSRSRQWAVPTGVWNSRGPTAKTNRSHVVDIDQYTFSIIVSLHDALDEPATAEDFVFTIIVLMPMSA